VNFVKFVKECEGKRPLERHSHRRECNIQIILEEICCQEVNWI
jgi:hypothetical protein